MKEFEELTFQEIADALDLPLSTVKSRLYTALRQLQLRLEKHGAEVAWRNERDVESDDARRRSTTRCARAEDLVAYLYGEATPDEAQAFRAAHRPVRRLPRQSLPAFGGVRERNRRRGAQQALGSLTPTAPSSDASPSRRPGDSFHARRRSARRGAARVLRALALWLRAATAAAALAVCALASSRVAHGVRGAANASSSSGQSGRGRLRSDVEAPLPRR